MASWRNSAPPSKTPAAADAASRSSTTASLDRRAAHERLMAQMDEAFEKNLARDLRPKA